MFAKTVVKGVLNSFPQQSNQKNDTGIQLFYVTISPSYDKVPAYLIKNRSFDWNDNGQTFGGRKQTTKMTDAVGDYCVYFQDQLQVLNGCQPGDEVECDCTVYPIRQAVQRFDGRIKTSDVHLLTVPKFFFVLEGVLRKAAPVKNGK